MKIFANTNIINIFAQVFETNQLPLKHKKMKTLNETIKTEVVNQLSIENFEVVNEISIMVDGKEKYQVVPEEVAETILEDFKNYDGFKAANFDFEGVTYYFVKQ